MSEALTKGTHYRSLRSDLSKARTAEILDVLTDSPALRILEQAPLEAIILTRAVQKQWNGVYNAAGRTVTINSIRRRGYHFGERFVPGEASQMSAATSESLESHRRAFLHEIGHHVLAAGGAAAARIFHDAHANPARQPITRYAARTRAEYFAETWVAYHTHRESLRCHDPVGYKMIEDVLKVAVCR